jgi:hypothetical protein
MKPRSVQLLNARARASGLGNVRGVEAYIEHYTEPFDVALGLHACGRCEKFATQKENYFV